MEFYRVADDIKNYLSRYILLDDGGTVCELTVRAVAEKRVPIVKAIVHRG
jgi:hypothetical protein